MSFRIFLLGAGFSKPAGLPLGPELWREIRPQADRSGRFREDLRLYREYRLECDGVELTDEQVDFEDFLGFLDIEHYLGLAGSDTWSEEGNVSQILIKRLIGARISEATPSADGLPDIYYHFARQLGPGDYVVSFNYDTIVERALEHVGTPYRLSVNRYSEIRPHGAVIDSSREEVALLKLHGSVDWFDQVGYDERREYMGHFGMDDPPADPVFGPDAEVSTRPILEGPQFPDDPLAKVHRVTRGLEALYRDRRSLSPVPVLLTPSRSKAVYAERFRYYWDGLGQAGGYNLGVVVIGYSLPQHDEYSRQAIFRLIKNYQGSWWDQEWPAGRRKAPVLMVDRKVDKTSQEAYRKRYGFVDPGKAHFHFAGFDKRAVDRMRDEGAAPS